MSIRDLLKNVGLLLASTLLCLVATEVYAYWFVWKPAKGENLSAYAEDLMLGKRLLPGFHGEHTGVDVAINAHGMRDREYEAKEPPGSLRILALGDSWTFGVGEKVEDTWPKRLEAVLDSPDHPVAVMNTGVSGYETFHEAFYYTELAPKFEHDVVVIGIYPVNDVHAKDKKYARYRRLYEISPLLLEIYNYPKHLYVSQLYNNWREARKYRRRAEFYARQDAAAGVASGPNPGHFAPGEEDWTELYTDRFSGWRTMQESFRSIGETARHAGVRGAAVLFPDLRDLARYRDYSHPKVEPLLRAAVESAGLVFIDTADDFIPYAGREPEISGFAGGTHPNAKGYDLIGHAVARELEARNLLVHHG
jgi:lysophospholipase L1-like esterase